MPDSSHLHTPSDTIGALLTNLSIFGQESDTHSEVPAFYITQAEDAQRLANEKLSNTTQLAVDLEFDDNRYAYGRTLSLIQLYDGNAVYLVDTVQTDLPSDIFRVFENPSVRKIFHSCASDLTILQDTAQCHPKNIEDTSLMYAFLLETKDNISLSRLLEIKADIRLKKGAQASNWLKRPLTESQLTYAAYDVVYLPHLYVLLTKELEQKGHMAWYQEERALLDNFTIENKNPALRLARKHKLGGFRTMLLQTYWEIIDQLAAQLNKPHYRVIDSKKLVELAEYPPRNKADIQKLSAHPRLKREPFLSELLHAKEKAETLYRANQETNALQKSLPNAMKWGSYKKNQQLLIERSELFDYIRERLSILKGEALQALVLPARAKQELVWEGIDSLSTWKVEVLNQLAQEDNIDIEPLRFHITQKPSE